MMVYIRRCIDVVEYMMLSSYCCIDGSVSAVFMYVVSMLLCICCRIYDIVKLLPYIR